MDVIGYRISGELSDITVVIDGEEFHLHKFPLFVRSNYFKNLSSLSPEFSNVSRVILDKFPGGPKTFAIVADYCYNKEIQISVENVVQVRCAAEYLEMSGGVGRGGLAMLAENVLFDLTYSAKSKRDYHTSLLLLENASAHANLAEKCGLSTKLIDSFVENLASFLKASTIYENKYSKSYVSANNLHHMSLDDDEINILNNLNLKWMNELIRSAVRFSLNQYLLSFIIQSYIDFNTGLNPNSSSPANNEQASNNLNLIRVAGDILRVDQKLIQLSGQKPQSLINIAEDILKKEENEEEETKSSHLKEIAGELIGREEKPSNLISIANSVLEKENAPSNLIDIANELFDKENTQSNLVNIASEILEKEARPSGLLEIAGDILAAAAAAEESSVLSVLESSASKPNALVEIAGEIFEKNSSADELKPSSLIGIAGDILEKSPTPSGLIGIASDILNNSQSPSNLINIASDILNSEEKPDRTAKKINRIAKVPENDEDKLKIIRSIVNMLVDLHVDPEFSISWLLSYMSSLSQLNCDESLKSTFHRWTWNALHNLKSDSVELSAVPAQLMIQLTKEISLKDENNSKDLTKLIDLTDRYVSDLHKEGKLSIDIFLKLISAIPKEKRSNFDNLLMVLMKLLQKEHLNVDSGKQKEILSLIDFSKVNEKSLEECRNSQFIPGHYVTEAALALCAKLRKELDEAKLIIKSLELKNRPSASKLEAAYSTSSSYSSKYSKPSRNRSNEPRTSEHRFSSTATNNQTPNPSSLAKTTTYPTPTLLSNTNYNYNCSYSSLTPRSYSSTSSSLGKSIATTVLNSSYKASSFNPSTHYHAQSQHSHFTYPNSIESEEVYYDYEPISAHYLDLAEYDFYSPAYSHY